MNLIKIKCDTKLHDEIHSVLKSKHPYLADYIVQCTQVDYEYLYRHLAYDCHLQSYVENHNQQCLPESLVLKWTYQVGLALDYLHYKGIIHTNVHEQNIWLTEQKDCKLSNFGLFGTEESLKYPSPELLSNNQTVTSKCDMWALGCVIHFMCTSQQAFPPQQKVTPEPKNSPRISQESYSSELQAIIDDLLEYDVMSRLGADNMVLMDVFRTIQDSCKESLPACQSKRINLQVDVMHFEESINNLKKKFAMDKDVIMQCTDKDLVLLIGNTGSGKSTLFSYLKEIPLKECTADELNVLSHNPYKTFIDVGDVNKDHFSVIGHSNESTTETPNILVIDEMIICDCPGFKATQGIEVMLSNAVKIQALLKYARSCKLIVVVSFSDISDSKLSTIRDVTELVKRMFSCKEMSEENKASVSFCITKLPKLRKKQTSLNISKFKEDSLIQSISTNDILIYDPLNRTNRLYGPIPSRDELLEQIKKIPHIENPKEVLGLGLSDTEELSIVKYEEKSIYLVTELLSRDETMLQAARIYQSFFYLKVLEHDTVAKGMEEIKKHVEEIFEKNREEIEEIAKIMGKANAEKLIKRFGQIRQSFFAEGNDEILEKMWNNYTKHRWKTVGLFIVKHLKQTSRVPSISRLAKMSKPVEDKWSSCIGAYSRNEIFASPFEALLLFLSRAPRIQNDECKPKEPTD